MISAYPRRRHTRQQRRTTRSFRIETLEQRVVLTGFTAYNGIEASALTDPNTTFYADIPGRDAAGPMRDVVTGTETSALLTTSQTGVVFDVNGSNPAAGTDGYEVFNGFVDFTVGDQRSYEIEPNAAYQYTFENLDSGATYQFAGTVIRGNNAYTDRWTLIELEGADSFTVAHSSGLGVVTNGLQSNQVAIWAGDNLTQGYAIINGEEVDTPKEIDLQYAVATALVGRAIRAKDTDDAKKVHGNILSYANHFPQREMGVMMVSDMHRAIGQDIFTVPEFASWADKIADLMLY